MPQEFHPKDRNLRYAPLSAPIAAPLRRRRHVLMLRFLSVNGGLLAAGAQPKIPARMTAATC
jgi:hypothetical protein